MVSRIYRNLPVNVIVSLPHSWSGDSEGQEMVLSQSADKETHNYDIECSNSHRFLSSLRSKGLRPSKMIWRARYTKLPVKAIVPCSDKQTCNYEIKCSNHHPSLSRLRSRGLRSSKIKWWTKHTNLVVNVKVRLPHPRGGGIHNQVIFLVTSADKQTNNYDIECSNHNPSLSTLGSKGLSRRKMKWWAI